MRTSYRILPTLALVLSVLAGGLLAAPGVYAQNAPTYGDCAQAWYESDASNQSYCQKLCMS